MNAMGPARVLVVDDAVVFRKAITDALADDPDVTVVGTASNGRLALLKIPLLNPDVVTLDVEMPELDGLATLAEIRRQWPKLPVIMCSSFTSEGAVTTMKALDQGANDFIAKPAGVGGMAEAMAALRKELLPRIKALTGRSTAGLVSRTRPAVSMPHAPSPSVTLGGSGPVTLVPAPMTQRRLDMLVIGSSTGGPNALADVLPLLPSDLPVPVLLVQHMPAMFTKLLADRLTEKGAFPVREATDGAIAKPGEAWIAPGGFHVVVKKDGERFVLRLTQDMPENSCRPAVDVLFRSVAQLSVPTLAVVLTGMGEDGLRGAQLLHAAGNPVLAQDQATSVVWGMPGAIAKAGIASAILPLNAIAAEIVKRLRHGRPAWNGAVRSRQPAAV